MIAEDGKFVSVHYIMKDENGNLLDSTRDGEPFDFIMGQNQILPKLENEILGKNSGEKFSVVLDPAVAYGEYDENLVKEVDRENFNAEFPIEVGMKFTAMTSGGDTVLRVLKVDGDKITVDANHELAGKQLFFDIEIQQVRDATDQDFSDLNCSSCGGECGSSCEGGCCSGGCCSC